MSKLPVSVVVPTLGRRESLVRLLDAIGTQTLSVESFEVILVVDGPADGIGEFLGGVEREFELVVVQQPRAGRAAACNRGILRARGSLVVLLDDDMQPVPVWLEAHLRAHEGSDRRCVLGDVPVRFGAWPGPLEVWVARSFYEHHERLSSEDHVFVLRDFYTGNTSIPRDVLLEVGCFDDAFRAYGHEDIELFIRLRGAGIEPAFSRAAAADQSYAKSFSEFAVDTRNAGRTAVLVGRKHPGAVAELTQFRTGKGLWPKVRRVLLLAARHLPRTFDLPIGLERVLAATLPSRMTLYYSLTADFFFWLGVEDADDATVPLLRP